MKLLPTHRALHPRHAFLSCLCLAVPLATGCITENPTGLDGTSSDGAGAGSSTASHDGATTTGSSHGGAGGESGGAGGDMSSSSSTGIAVLPSAQASDIATGALHTCAVTTNGGARCWGYPDFGQVGNGVYDPNGFPPAFPVPVEVNGLSASVTAIAAGHSHSCAVVGGALECWGANEAGELGNNQQTPSGSPVEVFGLSSGIAGVDAGEIHTCALTTSGGVKCWGDNQSGQLGDGSQNPSLVPVDVAGLSSGVASISAGRDHTCAVTISGGLKCWGGNAYGQQGNGSDGFGQYAPGDVSGLTAGVLAVSTGSFATCAVTSAGGVKCWGDNDKGQLGNGESGTLVSELLPVDVMGISSGATSVSVGYDFACAVVSGAAMCWGAGGEGVLGNGGDADSSVPVGVTGLGSGTEAISVGVNHACALMDSGAVKCWGSFGGGKLGNGDDGNINTSTNVPVDVVSLP